MTPRIYLVLLYFLAALSSMFATMCLFALPVSAHTRTLPIKTAAQQIPFTCTAVTEVSQEECEALVALYQSTNGANWTTREGWLANNRPCTWFGISCAGQQISKIRLNGKRLTGSLPETLGKLRHLQLLDLSNNSLLGTIPPTIGSLPLQELDLSKNQLSGALPSELGKLVQLQRLSLSGNRELTGALPATLVNLINLQSLTLAGTALCVPRDAALQAWLATIKELESSGLPCTEQLQTLTIYFLSFDNHAEDVNINLSPSYRAVAEALVHATSMAPNTTVALVVDLDGVGDSHIVIIRKGAVERVLGIATLNDLLAQKFAGWQMPPDIEPFLPDDNGKLTTPAAFEYNMTNGDTLGGVLRWLFTTYVQDAATTRTLVSYIGHGAAAVPDADLTSALGTGYCDSTATARMAGASTGIIALPSRLGAHPAFTDCHGAFDANAGQYWPALLAPRSLARALQTAFANSPVKQVDLLDLFHCFALSLEALVEFAPQGVALASMVIGSPNYTFFAPDMASAGVVEDTLTPSVQEWAKALMTRYEAKLRASLATPAESALYPRLVVAVDGAKIGAIADHLNRLVAPILAAWPDPTKRPTLQQSLQAAYQAAGKYDTTYCSIDSAAQRWELNAPDALVDLGNFAQNLSASTTDPVISAEAQALYAVVNDAIGERRVVENGIPRGLHPDATSTWDFTGYSGISLYSDFVRNPLSAPIGDSRNWQAHWYNNERMAYSFTAQSQWDDLLNLYWQADDPHGQVKKVFCLPVLVLLPEDAGAGVALTAINTPTLPPLVVDQPVNFAAQLLAESATTRYTEVLFQVTMNSGVSFSETVVIPKLLASGEVVTVATASPWTPSTPGTATLTVTVDPANRLSEENESNNTLTQLYTVNPSSQRGDCNGNKRLEAGDLSAIVFEIFDSDGNFWLDVPKGAFVGSYGCDANQDTRVDAGDLSCTARLIFNPSVRCGS